MQFTNSVGSKGVISFSRNFFDLGNVSKAGRERENNIITCIIAVKNRVPVAGASMRHEDDTADTKFGDKLALRRALKILKEQNPKEYKRSIKAIWQAWYDFNEEPVPFGFFREWQKVETEDNLTLKDAGL